MQRELRGSVQWEDTGDPARGVSVAIHDGAGAGLLARGTTGKEGEYEARWRDPEDPGYVPEIYVVASDGRNRSLASTHDAPILLRTGAATLSLTVPASEQPAAVTRPQVRVDSMLLDAQAVAEAQPEVAADIVRATFDPEYAAKVAYRIERLSPDLQPSRLAGLPATATQAMDTVDALIELKGWSHRVRTEVEDLFLARAPRGLAQVPERIHDTPHFRIYYRDSGQYAVDPDTSAFDVTEPGSDPPVVIAKLPAGGPPIIVKLVAFWLERSLLTYTTPPFGMRNPAAQTKILVSLLPGVDIAVYASARAIRLPADRHMAFSCWGPIYTVFELVLGEYGKARCAVWGWPLNNGGQALALDAVAGRLNAHMLGANDPHYAPAIQVFPHRSLLYRARSGAADLFFFYVAEQHTSRPLVLGRPAIGLETYRKIIEACEAGSWSLADIENALRKMPWCQDFYKHGYHDQARRYLTRSETTLGNFALACYLKDLGTGVPDLRFDFSQDEDEIRYDEFFGPVNPPWCQCRTLASVTMAGKGKVTGAGSAIFIGALDCFARRYYEVAVDAGVTNVEVQFSTNQSLSSLIFQIVLIDEDGDVREIYRTDETKYRKRFANLRGGKRLDRIVLVAASANSTGTFYIGVAPQKLAPDVMVTRWNTAVTKEYEIDSRSWAWTWVSPDVWVDNAGDGVADGVVLNRDNKLHIRLHNKGNKDAGGIHIKLWYQAASGTLSPTSWLDVRNKAGAIQIVANEMLAAGRSRDWSVDWCPIAAGRVNHFCVRASVSVPGDLNSDNKTVLSNLGVVGLRPGGHTDLRVLRRNTDLSASREIELSVVPRLAPGMEVSLADVGRQRVRTVGPGAAVEDVLRLNHWPVAGMTEWRPVGPGQPGLEEVVSIDPVDRPDPLGRYETDAAALPPGVAGKPLVTLVHLVDGFPEGGVTFMVDTTPP